MERADLHGVTSTPTRLSAVKAADRLFPIMKLCIAIVGLGSRAMERYGDFYQIPIAGHASPHVFRRAETGTPDEKFFYQPGEEESFNRDMKRLINNPKYDQRTLIAIAVPTEQAKPTKEKSQEDTHPTELVPAVTVLEVVTEAPTVPAVVVETPMPSPDSTPEVVTEVPVVAAPVSLPAPVVGELPPDDATPPEPAPEAVVETPAPKPKPAPAKKAAKPAPAKKVGTDAAPTE